MAVMHELPAQFPMTSRHFWLNKMSERVAARVARIADIVVTNSAHQVAQLQRISGRRDVHLLPNPSNIEAAPANSEVRTPTEFVLFGLPFGRLQALRLFAAHIRQWHAAGMLTKLHLIGPTERRVCETRRRTDRLECGW